MNPLNTSKITLKAILLSFAISLLSACGGGGDGEETAGNDGGEGGIIGTAKIIVKSDDVKAKEKSGNSYKAKIGENGKYKFSKLKSGTYLLRSESKTGQLYSVAYVSGGKTTTSNVHPITDLIIRNWFKQNGQDIDAQFKGSSAIAKMPKVAEINQIEEAIEGILAKALEQSGVKGSVNLMGNSFEVKTGDTFNTFLTNNQVIINNNQITLIFTGDKVQTISISGKGLETDFTKDNENPSTPSDLRALPSGTHEIVVVWKPSTDDRGVAGYNIYRNAKLVATTPYPVFTDKNLSQGTNYDYMVEAIDGVGKKSRRANSQVVTTLLAPDTQAPPAIANLSAIASDDDIALRWDITQVNDIARFIVKRGAQYTAKKQIASITSNTYNDFNLSNGGYCYTITAVDAAGNKSNESTESCSMISTGGTTNPTPNSIVCTSYTDLPLSTIDKDTTISAGCYKVKNNITVNNPAKLTIKPSVKLEFSAGTKVKINKGASLNAIGTNINPIIFTSKEPTPGYWDGIIFYTSNSIYNKLDFVTVEYGVRNIDTWSYDNQPARINIKNSTIRFASKEGVFVEHGSVKIDSFENNTLTKNERPISLPFHLVGRLGSGNYFTENIDNRIHVRSSTLKKTQMWNSFGAPYFFAGTSSYDVQASLTLAAGSKLIFNTGSGLRVTKGGSLTAIGTSSKPIVFTGQEESPGYWKGINFYTSGSLKNKLDHVVIEYGVKNINTWSYANTPARLNIKNSILRYASDVAVYIEDPSVKIDLFENNTVTLNEKTISIPFNLVGRIGSGNSFTGNVLDNNQIFIRSTTANKPQTWLNLGVPYFFESSSIYKVDSSFNIKEGAMLIFSTSSKLQIANNGYLNAIGTASEPIIFTAKEPTPGYWSGIQFYTSASGNNLLEHVEVKYGGGGGSNSEGNITSWCFANNTARFTIKNSTISDSLGFGVNKESAPCDITLLNISYSNNSLGNTNF